MPLDPHAARFLDMLAVSGAPDQKDRAVESYRSAFARLTAFSGPPERNASSIKDAELRGREGVIPIRVYSPPESGSHPLPTLVFFHGGGWVAGGLQSHDRLCRFLAEDSGCRIVAVDYRLAPENEFPAGLDDCCDALLALSSQAEAFGVLRGRIAVGGDSAGAHLAVGVCRLAGDLEAPIAHQLLLCPVIDPWGDWPSRRAFGAGFFLEETAMADYVSFYGPSLDPADPRLSPLRASEFRTLPPAHVHTAEFDAVRDEGRAYADALASAGVPVRYTCHSGMIHHFYGLTGVIPSARTALRAIGRGLGEALRTS